MKEIAFWRYKKYFQEDQILEEESISLLTTLGLLENDWLFNAQYVKIWNLLEYYRKKIPELRLIFIFTIFMMEIVISSLIVDDGCAHFHFHFSEVRENGKGELQKEAVRKKRWQGRKRVDRDKRISSLLRHDLISTCRRPLKTSLRNPLLHSHPLVSLTRASSSLLYTIPAAELRRANLRLKIHLSSDSREYRRSSRLIRTILLTFLQNDWYRERDTWL